MAGNPPKTVEIRIAGETEIFIVRPFEKWTFAIVAQLGEQRFCKPQVVGSSPSDGSFYIKRD